MSAPRLTIACLAAGLLASTVVACGGDDAPKTATATSPGVTEATDGAVPPNIITERDLAGQKPGTPGRTLLEFAQAIQFSDADSAAALSTQAALAKMGGRSRFDKAIGLMGASFSRVTVASVQPVDDATTRVRAWLSSYDGSGKRTAYTPTTFAMTKVDGQWKIDDLTLVSRTLRDFEALDRADQ